MRTFSFKLFRWAQWLIMGALLILWIGSCTPAKLYSDQSLAQISSQVQSVAGKDAYPVMDQVNVEQYIRFPQDINQYVFYRKNDAFDAKELLIVSFEGIEQAKQIEEIIQARIEEQKKVYAGYAPVQEAEVENALVNIQGNFALYYVGDQPQEVNQAFEKALKMRMNS